MNGDGNTVLCHVTCGKSVGMDVKEEKGARGYELEWSYSPPPDNQREFEFPEDGLLFSSRFDSGNLIQVERIGAYRYNMYTSPDCGNSPKQTNNRQWFHFAIRGGCRGCVITFTFVGMMHSKMFTYGWTPVIAVCPGKPQYTRLPGKATVVSLDAMPPTPGYPGFVLKPWSKKASETEIAADGGNENADGNGSSEGVPDVIEVVMNTSRKKKKENAVAMNLTFEVRLEIDAPLTSSLYPLGHPQCPATYIASNHPYSYSTLQQNIKAWKQQTVGGEKVGTVEESKDNNFSPSCLSSIYFHHEILCKSLDGRNVDLLTITDRSGICNERFPLCGEGDMPYSSARGETERPHQFIGKQCVVLTARVHPGESPSSHLMHGCIEFLLNQADPRAAALRSRFVFFLVPMINPDGVARGHSRADTEGANLNRMYKNPCKRRHPAPYSILSMLRSVTSVKGRLALFIDMHAHANKRGVFFYGNSMNAPELLQSLLYAKLVSMNTPYFEFQSSNFSEANMFATGKTGEGRDTSSRVTLYQETGLVHSYTIEASYVIGNTLNPIVGLSSCGVDEPEVIQGTFCPKYSQAVFADIGKGLLVALLDLKGCNPISRLSNTQFHSVKGLLAALQRQFQIEIAERLFKIAFMSGGQAAIARDPGADPVYTVMSVLRSDDIPDAMTIKDGRGLPVTTIRGLLEFVTLEQAIQILAHAPPMFPPRTLLYGAGRRMMNQVGGGLAGRRSMSNAVPGVTAVPAVSTTGRKSITGSN
ncbi:Carboxypeptidase-like protein [Trypanosoma cruzi]|uniref:Cytosolic carboxypeptidase-like protein 5 n=2 Tax=Trypanosoma cruzi TaxID=5693 RepID=Q4D6P1_TRYCC|nr:zinc carboxypeptidase, putative [Trypanosoma cruzi]EAN88195.1 zinc carboxypeptidase, putative [Trypanosoma cruzi]PWV10996.1 Carboxypeptidase-like protein [Trypanosoma cruzi]RNC41868.1 putative Zinc carboxypeptidase [Trypanosoma cruzi]|eukprot:XP_810046.1 zinc carboxypeptidase [Trypanosoma cruzi strain CL Brener]